MKKLLQTISDLASVVLFLNYVLTLQIHVRKLHYIVNLLCHIFLFLVINVIETEISV